MQMMMEKNTLNSNVPCYGKNNLSNKVMDRSLSRARSESQYKNLSGNKFDIAIYAKQIEQNWQTLVLDDTVDFHILLIGREQHARQSIRRGLSHKLNLEIEYVEAADGTTALDMIGQKIVDLIIFGDDVVDMDGLEFLGRLNCKCCARKIPVIEILNSEAVCSGIQVMKMGAHDFLLKDADGRHFELLPILVSRIYTEHKTMEKLSQTASVHRVISECIPSVVYLLSLQGGMHDVRISPQILELGISVDKWGNDTELHHQMCHKDDRPIVKKALDQCYQTGSVFQCEYRIQTLGDGCRWFHDKAKLVMDKYGRPLFLQGVMTDISGNKALEAELIHYRGMLEKMVLQRTEMLDRRIAILEYCNSKLVDGLHAMYRVCADKLSNSRI